MHELIARRYPLTGLQLGLTVTLGMLDVPDQCENSNGLSGRV